MTRKDQQLKDNYDFYKANLASIILEYGRDKFILMRNAKVIDSFDTELDAIKAGKLHYHDGLFSVQKAAEEDIAKLGFYSSVLCH